MNGTFALFGVLDLKEFGLAYDAGKGYWDVSIEATLPGGSDLEVALSQADGALAGASLDLTDVSFANVFTIKQLKLDYSTSEGADV